MDSSENWSTHWEKKKCGAERNIQAAVSEETKRGKER